MKTTPRITLLTLGGGLLLAVGCSGERKAATPATPVATEASAPAERPAPAPRRQETCPVMGGKIDPALYVDHAGKRIYVCCEGCLAPVRAAPATYIRQLEEAGVTLAPAPQRPQEGTDGS
jgi:hypothetical protein